MKSSFDLGVANKSSLGCVDGCWLLVAEESTNFVASLALCRRDLKREGRKSPENAGLSGGIPSSLENSISRISPSSSSEDESPLHS